jgi:iron(III) transport system permease protein
MAGFQYFIRRYCSGLSFPSVLHIAAVVVFIFLVFSPVIGLVAEGIRVVLSGSLDPVPSLMLSTRRAGLLFTSICFSAFVAATGILIGIFASTFIWRVPRSVASVILLLLLAMACIPPYIHALVWIDILGTIHNVFPFCPVSGWLPAVWVDLLAVLPLAVFLSFIALASVDIRLIDAARVSRSDMTVFKEILLPLAAPALGAAFGFLFLICCTDYSVPSLFGADIYALDIFARFSATGSPAEAFLYALPLLLVTGIVIFLSRSGIRTLAQTPNWLADRWGNPPVFPWNYRMLQVAAFTILLLQIVILFSGLFLITGNPALFLSSVLRSSDELAYSLFIAGSVIVLSVPFALAAAGEMKRPGIRGSLAWGMVLVPLAMPASLVGIGMITFWNCPVIAPVYPGILMPVLAAAARFAPFAAIILYVQMRFIDPALLESAEIFSSSLWKKWSRIRLPLITPGLLVSAGILAAFSLAELGATLIVAPPGHTTMTIRIYNYIHYGASGEVAGLCLAVALLSLAAGVCTIAALLWLYRRSGKTGLHSGGDGE